MLCCLYAIVNSVENDIHTQTYNHRKLNNYTAHSSICGCTCGIIKKVNVIFGAKQGNLNFLFSHLNTKLPPNIFQEERRTF